MSCFLTMTHIFFFFNVLTDLVEEVFGDESVGQE